jgi:hypothetical protein
MELGEGRKYSVQSETLCPMFWQYSGHQRLLAEPHIRDKGEQMCRKHTCPMPPPEGASHCCAYEAVERADPVSFLQVWTTQASGVLRRVTHREEKTASQSLPFSVNIC